MCVFCDIIAGKIGGAKVYEDDTVIAILDISQVTKGHCLVMPKKHYRNIMECDSATLQHLIAVCQQLAVSICTKLNAAGCNILCNTNEVAGQSVDHLHFHIIPRYSKDDNLTIAFKPAAYDYDLNQLAEQLKA